MGEKLPSPGEQAAFLIRLLAAIIGVLILVYLFVNTRPIVETKSLIRTNAEIMENIFSSNIATRATFDSKELDKLKNSELETIRHCSIGYFLQVRTKDDEWSFGYKPVIFSEGQSVTQEYPAAVFKNGIFPAKVTLTVYDNVMTRVSCMIEKAYKLGEVQSMEIPCLFLSTKDGKEVTDVRDCTFSVHKKEENNRKFICTASAQTTFVRKVTECRYLPDVTFEDAFLTYRRVAFGGTEKITLKVFPVKAGTKDCEALKKTSSLIAKKGEVGTVLLCIDEVK